jgi:hypothetical protein
MPGIIGRLHAAPDTGTITKQLSEPHSYRWGHWLPLLEKVIQVLTRNAEQRGDLNLAPTGRRDDLAQQLARVRRTPVLVALDPIFGHGRCSSVILLKIDPHRIATFEFESDAPRAVDMHGVPRRSEAPEGVKVKAKQIHLCGRDCNMKAVEADKNAFVDFRGYPRRAAG